VPKDRPKNPERLTVERMASADNRDSLGKVLMMGSVSYVPLIVCGTRCYLRRWPDEYEMQR
jgi:hypothetical protein